MRRVAPRLVTFDIDGTLLKSVGPKGNAAHHHAVNAAVNATFGINTKVMDIPHAGSTDMAIMRNMCIHAGISNATIDQKLSDCLADAGNRITSLIDPKTDYTHLVLPGVIAILERLKTNGVKVALATGNIENIARSKLKAAGISHYFSTGGFADDAEERMHIVEKAIQRSGEFSYDDVVHVGDALADVAISRQLGVDTVGVLTGIFTREQLEVENPLIVFDDLSDIQSFFKVLGFETK